MTSRQQFGEFEVLGETVELGPLSCRGPGAEAWRGRGGQWHYPKGAEVQAVIKCRTAQCKRSRQHSAQEGKRAMAGAEGKLEPSRVELRKNHATLQSVSKVWRASGQGSTVPRTGWDEISSPRFPVHSQRCKTKHPGWAGCVVCDGSEQFPCGDALEARLARSCQAGQVCSHGRLGRGRGVCTKED
ncbi:hypothetical protein BD289DRAFT_91381 [Coniella lustricola]|uniref:Uncharacterized protein n=1 Tax=Coniella lustricola TaxID=2025994 RepID=A0A2T3AH18_9PEZI|nr:hypothetical protein BD289DRAFT_91381 [Coniella lustricola]